MPPLLKKGHFFGWGQGLMVRDRDLWLGTGPHHPRLRFDCILAIKTVSKQHSFYASFELFTLAN